MLSIVGYVVHCELATSPVGVQHIWPFILLLFFPYAYVPEMMKVFAFLALCF